MSRHHTAISSRAWARIRRRIVERDGYQCRKCGRPSRLEVDHVMPLHRGGAELDDDNLQTLCVACHLEMTAVEKGTDPERLAWRDYLRALS